MVRVDTCRTTILQCQERSLFSQELEQGVKPGYKTKSQRVTGTHMQIF